MPCLKGLISKIKVFTMSSNLKQVVIFIIDQFQDIVTSPSVIIMNVKRFFTLLRVSVSHGFRELKSFSIFAGMAYGRWYIRI